MRWRLYLALGVAVLAAASTPLLPGAGTASSYPFAIGTKVITLPDPPVVTKDGRRYISFAVVGALRPGAAPPPVKAPPAQPPLGGKDETKRKPGSRGALLKPLLGLVATPAYAIADSTEVQLPGEHTEPEDSQRHEDSDRAPSNRCRTS
jgi:hypothetical protein